MHLTHCSIHVRQILACLLIVILAFVTTRSLDAAEMSASALTKWASQSTHWTGDDKPYVAAQATIDAELAAKKTFDYFQLRYHQRAQEQPFDPLAQYDDAYADLKQIDRFRKNESVQRKLLEEADVELARAPAPHIYHYARLRFLIDSNLVTYSPTLRLLGERLLARDSTDWDVKYHFVAMLGASPSDQALAQRYMHDLFLEKPGSIKLYTLEGTFYWLRLYQTHNKNDGEKAIADWTKYLELAPADDSYRVWAKHAIQDIQTEMARHAS